MNLPRTVGLLVGLITLGYLTYSLFFSNKKIDYCLISGSSHILNLEAKAVAKQLGFINSANTINSKTIVTENRIPKASLYAFFRTNDFFDNVEKLSNFPVVGININTTQANNQDNSFILSNVDTPESLSSWAEGFKDISCIVVIFEDKPEQFKKAKIYKKYFNGSQTRVILQALNSHDNLSTKLKPLAKAKTLFIVLPGQLIHKEFELLQNFCLTQKIPLLSNSITLIRMGALGGFAYDDSEIAELLVEVKKHFNIQKNLINFKPKKIIKPQLHINMDTLEKFPGLLDQDQIEEAITISGNDS